MWSRQVENLCSDARSSSRNSWEYKAAVPQKILTVEMRDNFSPGLFSVFTRRLERGASWQQNLLLIDGECTRDFQEQFGLLNGRNKIKKRQKKWSFHNWKTGKGDLSPHNRGRKCHLHEFQNGKSKVKKSNRRRIRSFLLTCKRCLSVTRKKFFLLPREGHCHRKRDQKIQDKTGREIDGISTFCQCCAALSHCPLAGTYSPSS